MRIKPVLTAGLLAFVIASLGWAIADVAGLRSTTPSAPLPAAANTPGGAQWVAYYFHGSTRCPTCRGIEANTRDAVAEEVFAGSIDLKAVNYEEPAHRHFVADFDLAFPSVILALTRDGAAVRWKNLDRVWELCDDKSAFMDYVRAELAQFKEDRP